MALTPTRHVADTSLDVAGHNAGSPGTIAMFTNSHNLQIVNSTLSVAGGDIHHHHHYHSEPVRDIWAVLKSIPNFRSMYQDMLDKATSGTGMWLVRGDNFRIWLEPNGDIKIFWGSGIPGAGKTVLASIVIQHLEALRQESNGAICVCYVYFSYSQRTEVTVRNVLEIIVKQTFERHPESRDAIGRTYAQHIQEDSEPTVVQLLGLLRELADRMACTFYVLDALDEAPTKIQLAVVKTLASLNVKLFITSRPLKTVQAKFPQAHTVTIIAQDTDIDLHIAQRIDESADLQYLLDEEGPSLKEEIIATIKQNCGGMFLHASLQLDALCECVSALDVRRTLKSFPSSIEDVYLRTWDRILKQSAEQVLITKAVLLWVLNASRPMTVEELGRAVATSPDSHKFQPERVVPATTLISLCRGLVTVEEESRLVRLVHYTAKDTLEGLLHESFPHPHSLLAAVCITHLAECGFQNTSITSEGEFKAVLKEDPLLAYASEAWPFHACAGLDVEETKHRTKVFINGSHAFPALTSFDRTEYFDILTPLQILGLYKLPMALIEGASTDKPNSRTTIRQQTPLVVASRSGHEALVLHLLSLPKTEVNWVDDQGTPALTRAARAGQEGIVRLLLADPRTQVNQGDSDGRSALMMAAREGREGVVRLLLAHHAIKVHMKDNNGWWAVIWAAHAGQVGIVNVLLAYPGIQVNLEDNEGWSAVMAAAFAGQEGVIKVLLAQPCIKINLKDINGWSAFVWAAHTGQQGVIKLLLAYPDIDLNSQDNEGRSTLMIAALTGQEGIVELLLAHPRIQVNLVNNNGFSALMSAASVGQDRAAKLLLAYPGIEVNLVDALGWSALIHAARLGHEAVVQLFLEYPGTEVNLVDNDGVSALIRAAHEGQEGVVKLLLVHPGIQINSVNNSGLSALMAAARAAKEAVIKLLLASPEIDVNLRDSSGWTILIQSARAGNEGIVELLLAHPRIQVNVVDNTGCSALMHAANAGHEGIIKLFLVYPGTQINLVNNLGWSALFQAAYAGREGVIKLLLAYPGIQVDLVDSNDSTALLLAAELGHSVAVELLFATGAFNINAFDKGGDTAIKMAAQGGYEAIVRMLLDVPTIDTTIRSTTDGHTAMSAAQANGHSVIVELLRVFEARNSSALTPQEIGELSLHDRTDEEGSDCDSEEAYFDAEEGEEDDDDLAPPSLVTVELVSCLYPLTE